MYINLDVVMRLVQIGLVVAGIGALITLAMLFKNLIHTLSALTGALDLLQRDLAKLEGPLDTVDQLSNTVNEIQTSAKRAANTAIDTFQSSSQHFMKWVDSKTAIKPEEDQSSKTEAENKEAKKEPETGAHFEPIQKKPAEGTPDAAVEVKKDTIEVSSEKESPVKNSVTPELPQAEVVEVILEKDDESGQQ